MKSFSIALAACTIALGLATHALAADTKTVEVTGQGINHDAALKDAMRNALEKGAGVLIASYSRTQDFQLIHDTVFSRADGMVTQYDVLDRGEGAGGLFYCRIRATVSSDAVARSWGEVQNVLHQRGNPKIMVYIAETIDEIPSPASILEANIEQRLIKSGFQVYDRSQLDAIAAGEADDAARRGDQGKIAALAKKFATQIFIMGHANANKADHSRPHGVALVNYNCDVQVKVFYTDTAKLLASPSIPVTRGGARGHTTFSPQAGKMAIHNAAAPLIDEMYETVMKSWAAEISFGGHIDVEVTGLTSLTTALRLKKAFLEIPGIGTVNGPQYSQDGMGVYRIRAKMTAEDLVMHLIEGDWPQKIDLVDASLNRIQAKWIGK